MHSSLKWWLISTAVGLVGAGVAAAAMFLPTPWGGLVATAAVISMVVARRNPAHWYRRRAEAAFGIACAATLSPNIHALVEFIPGTTGSLVIESHALVTVVSWLVFTSLCILDYLSNQPTPHSALPEPIDRSVDSPSAPVGVIGSITAENVNIAVAGRDGATVAGLPSERVDPSGRGNLAGGDEHGAAMPPGYRPLVPRIDGSQSVTQVADILQQHFGFKWVPGTHGEGGEQSVVYWPVRLRQPSAIHAVQAFAAAAISKCGATVALWLDDLGNAEGSVTEFETRVRAWFDRVGGDGELLVVRRFSEVVSEDRALEHWSQMMHWFAGEAGPRLGEMLKVAKLLPDSEPPTLEQLRGRRPRKLLTPPNVWTCIAACHMEQVNHPLLTLGGYDEEPLWRVWSQCVNNRAPQVGHLYNAKLAKHEGGAEHGHEWHMADDPLVWSSRIAIRDQLRGELEAEPTGGEWLDGLPLCDWTLLGCVRLPRAVAGEPDEIRIGQTLVREVEDLRPLDRSEVVEAVSSEVWNWLR